MSLGPMVKSPSRTVSPNAIPQEAISSFKAGTLAPPVTENNNIKSSLPKNTFSLKILVALLISLKVVWFSKKEK